MQDKLIIDRKYFNKNSVLSKNYLQIIINPIEEKLNKKSINNKTRVMNATS